MTFIIHILAVIFLGYGTLIALHSGFFPGSGWWLWYMLAAVLIAILVYHRYMRKHPEAKPFPEWFIVGFRTTLVLFTVVFLGVSALIVRAMTQPEPSLAPRYLIVLGGKVNGARPSLDLQHRLDAAVEYWQDHSSVIVIVSGGQGPDEQNTEADVMAYYLVNNGIPQEHILKETKSANTVQNIHYSAELLNSKSAPTQIVTSNFHVLRATLLAKKAGLTNVSANPTPCEWYMMPHYFLREFAALAKDFFFGNI